MAFLRILTQRIDPSHFDGLVALNAEVNALLADQPGLHFAYAARVDDGEVTIGSVWDTREQAEAIGQTPDELLAKFRALGMQRVEAQILKVFNEFVAAKPEATTA